MDRGFIGQKISTKEVGGNGRMDITHLYKYKEGTSPYTRRRYCYMYVHAPQSLVLCPVYNTPFASHTVRVAQADIHVRGLGWSLILYMNS